MDILQKWTVVHPPNSPNKSLIDHYYKRVTQRKQEIISCKHWKVHAWKDILHNRSILPLRQNCRSHVWNGKKTSFVQKYMKSDSISAASLSASCMAGPSTIRNLETIPQVTSRCVQIFGIPISTSKGRIATSCLQYGRILNIEQQSLDAFGQVVIILNMLRSFCHEKLDKTAIDFNALIYSQTW